MSSSLSKPFKRFKLDPDLVDGESDGDYVEPEHHINPSSKDKEVIPFDFLPKEIIQEICMLLSLRDKMSLRLVNRQLYTICSDPHLWTNVFIDDAYHKTNAPFIKSALKTCQPHVQSLSLRGQLPFSQYQSKIFNCKNIHTLNFYDFQIGLGALEKISSPSYLPHLQYLTLTYNNRSVLLFQEKFSCLSHLKKLVVVQTTWEGRSLFQKWLENNCLPCTFIIVGFYDQCNREMLKPIAHSAHFAVYERYRRPLDFDFYDIPKYSLQLGPNNAESVAVTADGELHITMKNMITPTSQPNDDDICQQYAVFEDKDIAPGLPVYTSQCGVNITVLGFSYITISLESFRLIVQDTPNVLEVSFKGSYVTDGVDSYLVPLSEHCLKLRGLNVSKLKPSTGDSLKVDVVHFWYLLSKMKCLESLSVHPCCLLPTVIDLSSSEQEDGSLDPPDIDLAAKDNMIEYVKSMSKLRGLDVIDCTFNHDCACNSSEGLVHEHLLPIISNLMSLIYLNVEFPFSSYKGIQELEEMLKIEFSFSPTHNSKGLEEVLQNCQQLSFLCIDNAKLTLPANPALYSSLNHLSLIGNLMRLTPDFLAAVAINSKKCLKHFSYNDLMSKVSLL